jgi:hypothetical protein
MCGRVARVASTGPSSAPRSGSQGPDGRSMRVHGGDDQTKPSIHGDSELGLSRVWEPPRQRLVTVGCSVGSCSASHGRCVRAHASECEPAIQAQVILRRLMTGPDGNHELRPMLRAEAISTVCRRRVSELSSDERAWQLKGGPKIREPASRRYDGLLLELLVQEYDDVSNRWLLDQLRAMGVGVDSIDGEPEPRVPCPCCGYDTLTERGQYDICYVCWWEDDGQDDEHADDVWGGPNGSHSLTQARANFLRHGSAQPERLDLRVGHHDPRMYGRGRVFRLVDGSVVETKTVESS